jgi:hypothetical protein
MMDDTQRLDWLEKQAVGYGNGWIVRMSFSGRGMRLHETSRAGAAKTPRDAIDMAMSFSETFEIGDDG